MNTEDDRFTWGEGDLEIEPPQKKPEQPEKRTADQRAPLPLITVNGRVVKPIIHHKK